MKSFASIVKIIFALTLCAALPACSQSGTPADTVFKPRVACVGEESALQLWPQELQELLGEGFELSLMHEPGDRHPDIAVMMYSEGLCEDLRGFIDSFKALPTHPGIYLCLPQMPADSVARIRKTTEWTRAEVILLESQDPSEVAAAVYATLDRYGQTVTGGKRIVFIGDSITDGAWGLKDSRPSTERNNYDGNHIYGHGYAANCAARILAEYPEKHFTVFNRGIGGNRLCDLEQRWGCDVLALRPDIVSVLVGVNDVHACGGHMDFADWEARYRALLDRTAQDLPGVKLVLCTPFVVVEEGDLSIDIATLDSIVRKIAADYGATLVPFDTLMARMVSTDRSHNARYWCWDGIHPTYAAHWKMAGLWMHKCRKLLR